MRKLSVCLLTAATAMAAAGAVPVTALAATGTYNIPGGKMIVIGGSMNGSNCEVPGFPGVNIRESIFRASIFQVPTSRTTACLPRISQSRISRIICFRTSRAVCFRTSQAILPRTSPGQTAPRTHLPMKL